MNDPTYPPSDVTMTKAAIPETTMNDHELLKHINRLTGVTYNHVDEISVKRLLAITIALLLTWFAARGIQPDDPEADGEVAKIWRGK